MKKDWKYVLYLAVIFLVYVVIKLSETKTQDWSITFARQLKDPYGTYALDQLINKKANGRLFNSYKTIYELRDSLTAQVSFLSLSTDFTAGKEDVDALFQFVEGGGTAFVSAHTFGGKLADTLALSTNDYLFQRQGLYNRNDTSWVRFTTPYLDTARHFYYKRDNIYRYFSRLDSAKATVIAKNDFGSPVTIRMARGKGQLLLNTTPLAFTNIGVLTNNNHEYAAQSLSYLQGAVYRTEHYHLGRMEAATPLRFVLTNEPLRWAYYVAIISVLLFMLFEAKRKQRLIPVIKPLANTSLEFVSTIGNLYFQNGDHKNIALKKIQYFTDYVRSHYYITLSVEHPTFADVLSKKSGRVEQQVKALVDEINAILSRAQISAQELKSLNEKLEQFYSPNQKQ